MIIKKIRYNPNDVFIRTRTQFSIMLTATESALIFRWDRQLASRRIKGRSAHKNYYEYIRTNKLLYE